MNKKRVQWIDLARFIAIILVVWGHYVQPDEFKFNIELIVLLRRIVYSFHIPLFFFISGICFHPQKYNSFKAFMIDRFNTILIPGYIGMFIGLFKQFHYEGISAFSYFFTQDFVKDLFWFNTGKYVYWFLGALFSVECIMYFITKHLNKKNQLIAVSCLFCFATFFQLVRCALPFSICSGLVCLPFYYIGYIKSKYILDFNSINYCIVILCGATVTSLLINYFDDAYIIAIYLGIIANPISYIIKASSGILVVVSFSKLVSLVIKENSEFLYIVGGNTLYVYIYQYFLIFPLRAFLSNYFENYSSCNKDLVNVFGSILTVVLISFIAFYVRRFCAKLK